MNTLYYIKNRFFSTFSLLILVLLLAACAGQQAATELAGLEITSLLEYKQAIDQSITSQENYYKIASNLSSSGLSQMAVKNADNALKRQAKLYVQLWQKAPPSQYNVLEFIDNVYDSYDKPKKELDTQLKEIDELYFSKIEKLTMQQDNINKSINALSKLYMGDDSEDRADLIKDYIVNTVKAVNDASKAIDNTPKN